MSKDNKYSLLASFKPWLGKFAPALGPKGLNFCSKSKVTLRNTGKILMGIKSASLHVHACLFNSKMECPFWDSPEV